MEGKSRSRGSIITRGDFLKGTAYVTLGVAIGLRENESLAETVEKNTSKSTVEMVQVPGGWFIMGDKKGDIDEKPHKVYLNSFWIDKYLVTQEEFEKVMGENLARWKAIVSNF